MTIRSVDEYGARPNNATECPYRGPAGTCDGQTVQVFTQGEGWSLKPCLCSGEATDVLGSHPVGLHRQLLRAREAAEKAVGRYESHLRAYRAACRENGVRPYHPFEEDDREWKIGNATYVRSDKPYFLDGRGVTLIPIIRHDHVYLKADGEDEHVGDFYLKPANQ